MFRPADRGVFGYYIRTVERFLPDSEWCVVAGGHARNGLEDNIRMSRDKLAPSNAALVRRVADLCDRYDRPVAGPAEARAILGLAG